MNKKYFQQLQHQTRDRFDPTYILKMVEEDVNIALGYGIPREELQRLLAEACRLIISDRASVLEAEIYLARVSRKLHEMRV